MKLFPNWRLEKSFIFILALSSINSHGLNKYLGNNKIVTLFNYDSNGNLVTEIRSDLKNSSEVVRHYEYNYLNQLISFKSDQTGQAYEYTYYPNGYRSAKSTQVNGIWEQIEFYYNHQGQLVNEAYIQDNQLLERSSYFAGLRFIDNLLKPNDSRLQFSLADRHNHQASLVFSKGQSQIESYHLTDYGELEQSNTPESHQDQNQQQSFNFAMNPKVYGSGYYDSESNLHYMGARYYSADIQRFMVQDSYNLLNRYNYANANPIMNYDPDGHLSSDMVLNIASASVAFTASFLLGPLAGVAGGEAPLLTKSIMNTVNHHQKASIKSSLSFISSSVTSIAATEFFKLPENIKLSSAIIGYAAVGLSEGLYDKDNHISLLKGLLYAVSGAVSGLAYHYSGKFMKNKLKLSGNYATYKVINHSKFSEASNMGFTNWINNNILMSLTRTTVRTTLRHTTNIAIDIGLSAYQKNNDYAFIADSKHQYKDAALTSLWGIASGIFNGIGSRYKVSNDKLLESGILLANNIENKKALDALRASAASLQVSSRAISPVILDYINQLN